MFGFDLYVFEDLRAALRELRVLISCSSWPRGRVAGWGAASVPVQRRVLVCGTCICRMKIKNGNLTNSPSTTTPVHRRSTTDRGPRRETARNVIVQADLGWNTQVNNIVKKAMLRKLTQFNLSRSELFTSSYKTFVRPTVEYAAPAWHAGLTTQQRTRIETIQKRACRTILGSDYTSYTEACRALDLPTLDSRRRDCVISLPSNFDICKIQKLAPTSPWRG
ncbi:hypothetical protein Bbelb_055610 [Branchiostoma belcheri]|nr:hypothetical protein Bbelb_055610 [Branchiostoma belcheri]